MNYRQASANRAVETEQREIGGEKGYRDDNEEEERAVVGLAVENESGDVGNE